MPLLLGTIGCVSSYKHVLVSVVDSTTGTPISGAKVITSYYPHSAFSLASRHTCEAVTGETGKAILSANYLPREPVLFGRSESSTFSPSYEVVIMNGKYQEQTSIFLSPSTDQELLARPAGFIPTMPDVVVEVTSEAMKARHISENDEQRRMDEQKAEQLFEKLPNFWPEHMEDPYPWPKDYVGQLLLSKRWQSASRNSLGTKEDIDSIRAVVVRHMTHPKAEVHELRWLSPSLVMVSSSWYTGPLASAGYTYVLQKGKDGWIVLAYYMDYVS